MVVRDGAALPVVLAVGVALPAEPVPRACQTTLPRRFLALKDDRPGRSGGLECSACPAGKRMVFGAWLHVRTISVPRL